MYHMIRQKKGRFFHQEIHGKLEESVLYGFKLFHQPEYSDTFFPVAHGKSLPYTVKEEPEGIFRLSHKGCPSEQTVFFYPKNQHGESIYVNDHVKNTVIGGIYVQSFIEGELIPTYKCKHDCGAVVFVKLADILFFDGVYLSAKAVYIDRTCEEIAWKYATAWSTDTLRVLRSARRMVEMGHYA